MIYNMASYLFNWNELRIASGEQFEAILILTYCIKMGYNTIIADNGNHLMKILNINTIPLLLYKKGYIKNVRGRIYSFYKCEEPQTYFNNPSFITARCNVKYKIQYLYLLGFRPIPDKNNHIPLNYIDKQINNPFIVIEENKIKFFLENIREG